MTGTNKITPSISQRPNTSLNKVFSGLLCNGGIRQLLISRKVDAVSNTVI